MSANSRAAFAVAAQIFFILLPQSSPVAAAPLTGIFEQLEYWIDTNTDLARASAPPRIHLADEAAHYDVHDAAMAIGGRTRALYEPETATITLVRPWSAADSMDVSVLLHELIHHRQTGVHFYCPGAKELAAYKLQEKWLAARDMKLDVNWIGVVLASSCTPRDIHPD